MTTVIDPSPQIPQDSYRTSRDVIGADRAGVESIPDCQACGACCSYSSEWPRFTTETDEALDKIPLQFVAADQRGMRCEDSRCSALSGQVGQHTSCLVYEARPDVCRACSPGDYACKIARAAFGLD